MRVRSDGDPSSPRTWWSIRARLELASQSALRPATTQCESTQKAHRLPGHSLSRPNARSSSHSIPLIALMIGSGRALDIGEVPDPDCGQSGLVDMAQIVTTYAAKRSVLIAPAAA